ncbi:MAG TPA: hypothetical protein DEF45_17745 [Rhodopirellula sp.]|nr:hypothetical protein [Rhodopirellula sp.]
MLPWTDPGTAAQAPERRKLIAIWDKHKKVNLPRTAILGVVASVCTSTAVAALVAWDGRPLAPAGNDSLASIHLWLWITTQALCLMLCPLALLFAYAAFIDKPKRLRFLSAVVNTYFLGFPTVILLDGLVYQWVGQRLFSSHLLNGMDALIRIAPFVTSGSLVLLAWVAGLGLGTAGLAWLLSTWLSKRIHQRMLHPLMAIVGLVYTLALASGASHLFDANARLTKTMESRTSAHPFYVFGILRTPTVGPAADLTAPQHYKDLTPSTTLEPFDQQPSSFLARKRRLRFAQPLPFRKPGPLPDVVVLVIESLRPELITPAVMPNLSRLAQEGMHCRYHFSGGNATNHGVFSLVTGLEPIWFGTSQRFDPLMFRWFKNMGYMTGFFAGSDDWEDFQMDGFIRSQLFDRYEAKPRNGIASDHRAVQRASAFLSREHDHTDDQTAQKPRLAFVYLYGTHALYQSYPRDQIDQPAADNRFPFPYPTRIRDRVWNRYCNSARTVDRLLKTLLRRDSILVAVGDHGEAFLEDGTVGHGTRLSRYQNMTPAILYCPGTPAQTIEQPTCHADILPTILSFLEADLSDAEAIDGVSLTTTSEHELIARSFCVRNYLTEEYGLIGPWTSDLTKAFAYRFTASIKTESASHLNGIDERGQETEVQDFSAQTAEIANWMSELYRKTPPTRINTK